MALPGSYQNASTKPCWQTCGACFRCKNKDVNSGFSSKCNDCSGRHDPSGHLGPDKDDYCECTIGVLRWRDKTGKLRVTKYNKDPFAGGFLRESRTEDEEQWDQYLLDVREKMDNPNWNPIRIS